MDVGLESVQTCLDGPSSSSSWAWAGAQFGLLSIPCKPTLLGFQKILHWVEFEDMWRVLLLVVHTAWRARRTRLELEVRNEHLQSLVRTEFGVFDILHQWRVPACPGKLLITSNFDASFLTGTSETVTWLSKKPPLGKNSELDNFSSTFLASFLTFLHTLTWPKFSQNFFSGIPRETKCFTTTHLPKDWSGFAVKSNGLPQLFQGKVFHDWSTWHLGKNNIASCCLGTLELKDNYYQPKRFEK